MTNSLRERLESAALKAEKQDTEYWDREYSGDIDLGRAKLEIQELKQQIKELKHKLAVADSDRAVLLQDREDLEKEIEGQEEYLYESQLKSISWNLNRIANVLEEVVPNNKTVGENILRSIRKGGK